MRIDYAYQNNYKLIKFWYPLINGIRPVNERKFLEYFHLNHSQKICNCTFISEKWFIKVPFPQRFENCLGLTILSTDLWHYKDKRKYRWMSEFRDLCLIFFHVHGCMILYTLEGWLSRHVIKRIRDIFSDTKKLKNNCLDFSRSSKWK